MKRFLISLMFLVVFSTAFADTLYIVKGFGITDTGKTVIVKYENMKKSNAINEVFMKDNEYILWGGLLYYKIDGKLHLTSMFDVEFD